MPKSIPSAESEPGMPEHLAEIAEGLSRDILAIEALGGTQEAARYTEHLLAGFKNAHDAACNRSYDLEASGLGHGNAEYDDVKDTAEAMVLAMAATPGRTLAGIKSKVESLLRYTGKTPDGSHMSNLSEYEACLAASILRDVIALA
jgi:hypothetical protein